MRCYIWSRQKKKNKEKEEDYKAGTEKWLYFYLENQEGMVAMLCLILVSILGKVILKNWGLQEKKVIIYCKKG